MIVSNNYQTIMKKSVSLSVGRGEKSKSGGLTAKGRAKYNEATGSNLKAPVSAAQAKKSPKAAGRRKSFCARMSGVKGPTSKNGKLTRKGLALKKWDC
jgi:hypothetical protein